MIILFYSLAFLLYCFFAYLGTLTISPQIHYPVALGTSILASSCWVAISRSVEKSQLSIYGLIYDILLAFAFLLIPQIFVELNFGLRQWVGVLTIFIGFILVKL